jgi:hypothetical protein
LILVLNRSKIRGGLGGRAVHLELGFGGEPTPHGDIIGDIVPLQLRFLILPVPPTPHSANQLAHFELDLAVDEVDERLPGFNQRPHLRDGTLCKVFARTRGERSE